MNDISKFLHKEMQYEAILGPFESKPIDMHISPLLVRDKQILPVKEPLWPKRGSVNNGVAKDVYLGTSYQLNYPSIDLITNSLRNLSIKFQDKYFIDRSVAFGFCHGFVLPSEMDASFQFLKKLLRELGLDISMKKIVPPSTAVTCLGILVDSVQKNYFYSK